MHYKDQRVLVEGPLTSLKPCFIQFSKPRAMNNRVCCCASWGFFPIDCSRYSQSLNRYMNPALLDTIMHGRSGLQGKLGVATGDLYSEPLISEDLILPHDPVSFVSLESATTPNLPMPVGMFNQPPLHFTQVTCSHS